MTIRSCRSALVCLSIALMLPPATRAAEAAPPAPSPATTETESTYRAQFVQLSEYLSENALETSYVSQNRSLGTSRGTAHFVIGRPNLLRVEITAPNFSYLLISDGDVLTIYNQIINNYTQVLAPRRPLGALMLFTGLTAFEAQVLRFLGVISDVARVVSASKSQMTVPAPSRENSATTSSSAIPQKSLRTNGRLGSNEAAFRSRASLKLIVPTTGLSKPTPTFGIQVRPLHLERLYLLPRREARRWTSEAWDWPRRIEALALRNQSAGPKKGTRK